MRDARGTAGRGPGAFDEVVREHRRAIYDLARRVTGDHAAADEVAQETFLRAWRAYGAFRGESAVRTWLFRIALNVMRSRPASPRLSELSIAREPRDPGAGPDAAVDRGEVARRVRRAVAALPPRQREVVVLKALTEMTYDEVASVMGLSVGAVKAHFHQAVGNLRRILAVEAGDER